MPETCAVDPDAFLTAAVISPTSCRASPTSSNGNAIAVSPRTTRWSSVRRLTMIGTGVIRIMWRQTAEIAKVPVSPKFSGVGKATAGISRTAGTEGKIGLRPTGFAGIMMMTVRWKTERSTDSRDSQSQQDSEIHGFQSVNHGESGGGT